MSKIKFLVCFVVFLSFQVQAQTITFYSYGDNFSPKLIQKFSQETGIEVQQHNFNSINEINAYLRGELVVDVAIVPHLLLKGAIDDNLITKLDYQLLPNSTNIKANIRKKLAKINVGNQYAVPFMYGSTKIAINRILAEQAFGGELPNSWDLVFDLKTVKKLSTCGIGFMNEPIDVMSTLLNYMGVAVNQVTDIQLTKAGKLLAELAPYVKTVSTKYRDEFKAGDLCVAVTRTPILGEQITPVESVFMTVEVAVIGSKSTNVEAAHKFIDFFIRPAVAAQNLAFTNFPMANNKIKDLVSDELATNSNLFPTDRELSFAQLLPNLPNKSLSIIKYEFDKLKK